MFHFKRCVPACVCALHRRVHVSQSTKDSLQGEYELEPGNGGERCEYLLEKGIDTYLVQVAKQVANGLNGTVSGFSAVLILFLRKMSMFHVKSSFFESKTQYFQSILKKFTFYLSLYLYSCNISNCFACFSCLRRPADWPTEIQTSWSTRQQAMETQPHPSPRPPSLNRRWSTQMY